MFGNSGGLFGNQNSGGGLFGNQPKPTGSLFGNPQPQSGGGLFGQQVGQPQQSTSLFGQPAQTQMPASTTSLFGAPTQSTGLFGQSTFGAQPQQQIQPTQTSSLFGQTSTSGGLFGNNQNQQKPFGSTGVSLFGGQQQTQPTGGLFGGNTMNTSTNSQFSGNSTGLFGGSTTTNSSLGGNSLFGNNNNQNRPQQPAMSSFFGSTPNPNQQTMNQNQGMGLFGAQPQIQNQNPSNQGTGSFLFGSAQNQNLSNNLGSNMNMGGGLGFTSNYSMNTQPGTYHVKYNPTKVTETSNVSSKAEHIFLVSITAMQEFHSKSIEELRSEDYAIKKKGGPIVSGTGFSSSFGMTQNQPQQQQQGSLFGGNNLGTGLSSGGGGLFGNNNTSSVFGGSTMPQTTTSFGGSSTGGGLFSQPISVNQTTQPQQSTGLGGLFGNTQKQEPSGGSLFGNQNKPASTGLFGNVGTTTTTTSSSLFGGTTSAFGSNPQPTTNPSGSLFGNTQIGQQSTQPTSSLFGASSNPQPQAQSSSLFGGQTQQSSGGLFGGSTSTGGGSLFGGSFGTTDNKPSQPSSSLFGSTAGATTTSSSLFGGTTDNKTTTGGLFGSGGGSLFGGTTQPTTTSTSLFGNPQPTSGSSLFGSTTQPQIQPQMPAGYNLIPNSVGYPIIAGDFLSKPCKTLKEILSDLQKSFDNDPFSKNPQDEQFKTTVNLGVSKYSYFPENFQEEKRSNEEGEFLKTKRPWNNLMYSFKQSYSSSSNNQSEVSREYMKNIIELSNKTSKYFNIAEDKETKQSVFKSFSGINLGEDLKLNNPNLVDLRFNLQDPIKFTTVMKVNRQIKISTIKNKLLEKLKDENSKIFKKINTGMFFLMSKYSILKENQTVEESKLDEKDVIHILVKSNIQNEKQEKKKKSNMKSALASIDKLPILKREGYKTEPSMVEISRMTLEELENVKGFKIFNKFGKIEFLEDVDLSELNLDNILEIDDRSVLVYQNYKVEEGKELNKPANIHLFRCFPKSNVNDVTTEEFKNFEKTLKKLCTEKGTEFVSYNTKTGEWIFKAKNFN